MQRRELLKLGASLAGGLAAGELAEALPSPLPIPSLLPIIDTHIHLFDPGRPGGVPWPDKTDTELYKASYPARFRRLAVPFGVVGAIVIEASPLPSDNDWVLNVAAKDPIIVGTIGSLIPSAENFEKRSIGYTRILSFSGCGMAIFGIATWRSMGRNRNLSQG